MSDSFKPDCKYGSKCYRSNPDHLENYNHIETKPSPCDSPPAYNLRSPRNDAVKRSVSPMSPNKSPKKIEPTEHASKKMKKISIKDYFTKSPTPNSVVAKSPQTATRSTVEPQSKYDVPDIIQPDSSKPTIHEFFTSLQRRDVLAAKKEYKEMLMEPDKFIREHFLVKMPDDFYHFWVWVSETAGDKCKPEEYFSEFNLELVGPFDVLSGKFNEIPQFEPADYLRHYRFYYDPPEFQTVFIKKDTGIHYGYWRDDPNVEEQYFIARSDQSRGCHIELIASNIFSALIYFLKTDGHNFDPKIHENKILELESLSKKYGKFADLQKKRKTVCKLFHKAGLSVPYDRRSELGYRPLIDGEAHLRRIIQNVDIAYEAVLEHLQPLITAANIAVDEGDFGASLELGLDLFSFGKSILHPVLLPLMITGYMMVKRPQYVAIIKSHLENRTLSLTDVNILNRSRK